MQKKWKILNKKTVFKNKWRILEEWKIKTPSRIDRFFYIDKRGDVVIVLGVTKDKKILVINQYYVAQGERVWSLVAGFIEKGENAARAAKRELQEETGYSCSKIVSLGEAIKGKYSIGKIRFYLATDVQQVERQHLEAGEEISVHQLPLSTFKSMLGKGKFKDTFTEVCAWRALNYLGEL